MFARIKEMLGFKRHGYERGKPDNLTGAVAVAVQRNQMAGENARNAIAEMLERNDRLRGNKQ